ADVLYHAVHVLLLTRSCAVTARLLDYGLVARAAASNSRGCDRPGASSPIRGPGNTQPAPFLLDQSGQQLLLLVFVRSARAKGQRLYLSGSLFPTTANPFQHLPQIPRGVDCALGAALLIQFHQ